MLGFFEKLFYPFPSCDPSPLPSGFLAFLWACTQGVRDKIMLMAVLTMFMSALEVLLIAMFGKIVDWLGTQIPSRLWVDRGETLLWLVAIMVTSIAIVMLQTVVKHQVLTVNLPMRLRWNFHRLMLGQSMTFYQDASAGRIATKVMQTSIAVRESIFVFADVIVTMSVYVTTILILAGMIESQLVWPFVSWLVLYIVALFYFVPLLGKFGKEQADAHALLTGRLTDAYTNIATVKLFSHAQREAGYTREAMHEFIRSGYSEMRLVSVFEVVNHLLSIGLMIGVMGTALWLWSHGAVGVGAVAASTAMALRLQGISQWLMWEMTSLFENVGIVQDGMTMLSTQPSISEPADAVDLSVTRGEIAFERISFRYSETGRRVIDDLSLKIKSGEKIGLVGCSGAGKSTLLNLLLRFHDLESGRIMIDGQNIARAKQDSLRSQISMVTQDISLLHRSIVDNISYGKPDATFAEIEVAALRAEAHTFIQRLGEAGKHSGYETHVGDRGVKLSGGQRQRIAIARVILKDAPILLLDEATSALDSETEAAIQQSLYQLMEGKTVIAIAHRLSTIAAMDRLIVLDDGGIAEEGDHASLLAHGGLYARLWAHQSGGFIRDLK